MQIICLVENTAAVPACTPAHGLSLFIETAHSRILMDAGPSPELLRANAEALGVDLGSADCAVLSHGHYDHADGLPAASGIPVYLHRRALGTFCSASPDGSRKYIGVSDAVRALPTLHPVEGLTRLTEDAFLFDGITGRRLWPAANLRLSAETAQGHQQDPFDHELCLVVEENGLRVLLSGCAHNGILNILDRFGEVCGGVPDVVISGFHMKKSAGYSHEEEAEISQTAKELTRFPCRFYTCHCTGLPAYEMMKEIMGAQLNYLACGDRLQL